MAVLAFPRSEHDVVATREHARESPVAKLVADPLGHVGRRRNEQLGAVVVSADLISAAVAAAAGLRTRVAQYLRCGAQREPVVLGLGDSSAAAFRGYGLGVGRPPAEQDVRDAGMTCLARPEQG